MHRRCPTLQTLKCTFVTVFEETTHQFLLFVCSCTTYCQVSEIRGEEGSMQHWCQRARRCMLCVLVLRQGLRTHRTGAFCQSDCQVSLPFFAWNHCFKIVLAKQGRVGIQRQNHVLKNENAWKYGFYEARKDALSFTEVCSASVSSNSFSPPLMAFFLRASTNLWMMTVQTSSAVSVWIPTTTVIISSCSNTLFSLAYRIARFRLLPWVSVTVWPHSSEQASSCSFYHILTITLWLTGKQTHIHKCVWWIYSSRRKHIF